MSDVAKRLVELCGSKLVAITDGSRGSVLATSKNVSAYVCLWWKLVCWVVAPSYLNDNI